MNLSNTITNLIYGTLNFKNKLTLGYRNQIYSPACADFFYYY